MSFKMWMEGKFPYEISRKVGKKIKKRDRQRHAFATFGMDIEFGPYGSEEDSLEVDWYYNGADISRFIRDNYYEAVEGWMDYYADERITVWDWERDNPEPPTYEEWLEDNPEPDVDEDEEEWNVWDLEGDEIADEYTKWETEKEEVEQADEEWEPPESFEDWLEGNWTDYTNFWELVEQGIIDQPENEVGDIVNEIEYEVSEWDDLVLDVSVDEADKAEITTETFTRKDFPRIIELLEALRDLNLNTASDTSAHMHVGFPPGFSILGELSLFTLVDEEKIIEDSGRNENTLQQWSRKSEKVLDRASNILWSAFEHGAIGFQHNSHIPEPMILNNKTSIDPDWQYVKHFRGNSLFLTENELKGVLDISRERRQGVNLTNRSSNLKYDRVEFRYMTSNLINDPSEIMSYLNYFSTCVEIASRRTRVTLPLKDKNASITIFTPFPNRYELRFKKRSK